MGTRREPGSRPGSPTRHNPTLQDIPEATPGPNAFAQQASRMEQHRYHSNAFYQQQADKRNKPGVSAIHPALREPQLSDADLPEKLKAAHYDPRESTMTTMSPFINAGKQPQHIHIQQAKSGSPELKLVPDGVENAMPTRRGWIEERDEQNKHAASGAVDERTPVFQYTPKDSLNAFSKLPTPKKKAARHSEGIPERPKSPKKGLLERFRMSNRGTLPPPPPEPEEAVPPKAQAILGTSPSHSSLTRSPSNNNKKKGIFSRKAVLGLDTSVNSAKASGLRISNKTAVAESPITASSAHVSSTKTPQTAFTDPSNNQSQDKRIISQTLSERGADKQNADACLVARSQSLNYFDRRVPPTPPAKNTPPEEKARKEAASQNGCTSGKRGSRQAVYDEQTPSKPSVTTAEEHDDNPGDIIISKSNRLSPTKYGSYGRRQETSIKAQPRVRSYEASVVTDPKGVRSYDASASPDNNASGLGITNANFAMDNPANNIYSPSIYQSNWTSQSVTSSPIQNPLEGFLSKNRNSPERPPKTLTPSNPNQKSNASIDSKETIEICYPDLASDPNYHPRPRNPNQSTESFWSHRISVVPQDQDEPTSTVKPQHGATHSRDHSKSPHHSMDTGIFARPIERLANNMSPQSFHPSAMPSPLEYLPATTFTPLQDQARMRSQENEQGIPDEDATPKANVKVAKGAKHGSRTVKLGRDNDETPTKASGRPRTKLRQTGSVLDKRRNIETPATPARAKTPLSPGYTGAAIHENADDFSFPSARAPANGLGNVLANGPSLPSSRVGSPLRIVPPVQKGSSNNHKDPQKVSPTTPKTTMTSSSGSKPDKLDQLLSMMTTLHSHMTSQDSELKALRTEQRANHAELSDRLTAVEKRQDALETAQHERDTEEAAFAATVEAWHLGHAQARQFPRSLASSSPPASLLAVGGEADDDAVSRLLREYQDEGKVVKKPVHRMLTREKDRFNGPLGRESPRELYQRHSILPPYYSNSASSSGSPEESGKSGRSEESGRGRMSEMTGSADGDEYGKAEEKEFPLRGDSLQPPHERDEQDDEVPETETTAYNHAPADGSSTTTSSSAIAASPDEREPRSFAPQQQQQQVQQTGTPGHSFHDPDHRVAEMIARFSAKLEDMERKLGQQQQQQQQKQNSSSQAVNGAGVGDTV